MSMSIELTKLGKDDLQTILFGATFLASGGGGSFSSGQCLVNALVEDWTVEVHTLKQVLELKKNSSDDWLAAVVAYIGAPQAIADLGQPTAAMNAFNHLNELYQENIGYIVPVEIGGLSTIVAATVAGNLKHPVVNADGAGRAVPTLTMTTFAGAVSSSPAMFCNEKAAAVVLEIVDVGQVEAMARPLLSAPAFNQKAGLAMWPMTKTDMEKALPIRDTLGTCLEIGRVLRNIIEDPSHPIEDLFSKLKELGFDAYILAEGRVHLEGETPEGGFDFGKVSFRDTKDDNPLAYVYNQNENMIAWSTKRDRPLAIGPDLICYVTKKGQPFSNDDISEDTTLKVEGEESLLIGIAANPALTSNQSIMDAFRESLIVLGYAGSYVPIAELQKQ